MPKIITNKERIDRLTKELAKLKAEKDSAISYLKKEVRALKASKKYYANRLSNNVYFSSSDMESLRNENQTLKEKMEQLKAKTIAAINQSRIDSNKARSFKNRMELYLQDCENHTIDMAKTIAGWQNYFMSYDDRVIIERLNNGEMYDEFGLLLFNEDFFVKYNPKNGRALSGLDFLILKNNFYNRLEFHRARHELDKLKQNNPNISKEELDKFIYAKGLELLPIYKSYII